MAYKSFNPGDEALAADVNNYLMAQTVARFPTAAVRTTQLAAPTLNQLSMLDSRPGVVQYWTGAAWADVAPLFQSATGPAALDANGAISFAFPIAFGATPSLQGKAVVAAGTHVAWTVNTGAATSATTGQLIVTNSNSTPVTGSVTLTWQAMGPRA